MMLTPEEEAAFRFVRSRILMERHRLDVVIDYLSEVLDRERVSEGSPLPEED